jgi:hypothetical protein
VKRDRSLLVVLALLLAAAVTGVIHYYRMIGWIENWDDDRGSVDLDSNCMDCYAFQFYGGDIYQFIAVFFFLVAIVLIFRSWRKSSK